MAKVIDPKHIAQVDEGLKFGWGFTSAETVAAWEYIRQAITQEKDNKPAPAVSGKP